MMLEEEEPFHRSIKASSCVWSLIIDVVVIDVAVDEQAASGCIDKPYVITAALWGQMSCYYISIIISSGCHVPGVC